MWQEETSEWKDQSQTIWDEVGEIWSAEYGDNWQSVWQE